MSEFKNILFFLFISSFSPLFCCAQNSQTENIDSLWKIALDEISIDSCNFTIGIEFWYDMMPDVNDGHTCWGLQGLKCKRKNGKIYFPDGFKPNSVYFIKSFEEQKTSYDKFTFNNSENMWKRGKRFFYEPIGVILVLEKPLTGEFIYLKRQGPFLFLHTE